jgi:hypothetical protein
MALAYLYIYNKEKEQAKMFSLFFIDSKRVNKEIVRVV